MRQVISISLPGSLIREIKKSSSKRGFSSLSAYFRHLYEGDAGDLISEAELLETVRLSRSEYKNGKILSAGSLVDLI